MTWKFIATQKADAVRKHLKDRLPVSQSADEMKVQPTVIHNWINAVLGQAEHDRSERTARQAVARLARTRRRQQRQQNESLALAS